MVSAIGNDDTDVNADGEGIIAGKVRHLAGNILINQQSAANERDGVCQTQFVSGALLYERLESRTGEVFNKPAVCVVFGERGAPVLLQTNAGERLWPNNPSDSSTEYIVAGMVIGELNKEGVCSDSLTRVTNVVFQITWIYQSMKRLQAWAVDEGIETEAVDSPFQICPSATPTRTSRPTRSPSASVTAKHTTSPSPSPAPIAAEGIDWLVIGLASGAIFICVLSSILLCVRWNAKLKSEKKRAQRMDKVRAKNLKKATESKVLTIKDELEKEDMKKKRIEDAAAEQAKRSKKVKTKSLRRKQKEERLKQQQRKKRGNKGNVANGIGVKKAAYRFYIPEENGNGNDLEQEVSQSLSDTATHDNIGPPGTVPENRGPKH